MFQIADFLVDEETDRPDSVNDYRCHSCDSDYRQEQKSWVDDNAVYTLDSE